MNKKFILLFSLFGLLIFGGRVAYPCGEDILKGVDLDLNLNADVNTCIDVGIDGCPFDGIMDSCDDTPTSPSIAAVNLDLDSHAHVCVDLDADGDDDACAVDLDFDGCLETFVAVDPSLTLCSTMNLDLSAVVQSCGIVFFIDTDGDLCPDILFNPDSIDISCGLTVELDTDDILCDLVFDGSEVVVLAEQSSTSPEGGEEPRPEGPALGVPGCSLMR